MADTIPEVLTPNQRAGQTKRANTRQRVLKATSEILAQKPIDQLRISEIAARAQLGVATIHQVFGQKSAILRELFWQFYGPVEVETRKALGRRSDLKRLLPDHLLRLGRAVSTHPEIARAFLLSAWQDDQTEDQSPYRIGDACQSILDSGIRSSILPTVYAGRGMGFRLSIFVMQTVISVHPDERERALCSAVKLLTYPIVSPTREARKH